MKTIVATMLLLAGCSGLPWDADGPLERVRRSQVLRAGIIAGETNEPIATERRFLDLMAMDTGSRINLVRGSAEELLPQIERGELDIVIGNFASDTPWTERVTIMPTARQMGARDGESAPGAAVKNGENGWITLVYEHAPALKGNTP
jgi:hypothetical protein